MGKEHLERNPSWENMILSWDAVTLDCRGGVEAAIVYSVRRSQIRIVGYGVNLDGSPAPLYAVDPWINSLSTVDTQVTLPIADPPVGECVLLDIEATDAAGNVSSDSCP